MREMTKKAVCIIALIFTFTLLSIAPVLLVCTLQITDIRIKCISAMLATILVCYVFFVVMSKIIVIMEG